MSGVTTPASDKKHTTEKKTSIISKDKKQAKRKASEAECDKVEKVLECKKTTKKLKLTEDMKTMPTLPPINVNELATLLRNPNMPAQKMMSEVADKIVKGGSNIFDCIFEVSLHHSDSDHSDDEECQFHCRVCNKMFESSMEMEVHRLIAHPRDDSTVLSPHQGSLDLEQLEKSGPSRRKRSKSTKISESDSNAKKPRHSSKSDEAKSNSIGEENIPVGTRRSSISRSQAKVSHHQTAGHRKAARLASSDVDRQCKTNEPRHMLSNVVTPPDDATLPVTSTSPTTKQSSQGCPKQGETDLKDQILSTDAATSIGTEEPEGPTVIEKHE